MLTPWQRVILRNYGTVSNDKIASVIKTDALTVEFNAKLLGLSKLEFDSNWLKKGFVTIIRNNFHLIENKDIAFLLEKDEKQFDSLLKDYDFLSIKLGQKPPLLNYDYSPLTELEKIETEKARLIIEKIIKKTQVKPFDFFINSPKPLYLAPKDYLIKDRFIASYCADYGDALCDDELKDYSEQYLEYLSSVGINGIWLHETLRNLSLFPFEPEQSIGYEQRRLNLKKLTERCKKYGIGVYLYLNEPRSLPEEFFNKFPSLRGRKCDDGYCLCTSVKEVKEYLYNATKSLAENVPDLKAVITITMSENPTHCKWRNFIDDEYACPNCKDKSTEELAAEVNNIIYKGLVDGNGKTKLIANLWGWSSYMNWTDEMTNNGIKLLDKGIEVLCVSEYSKKINRGGVNSEIIDYSISAVGPSETTERVLNFAKSCGHKIWAKIQVNNSWECAGTPYIPAFNLMTKHIENLKKLGVEGLMMGWSLGGYPGGALPLCNIACGDNSIKEKDWYDQTYGENSNLIKNCVDLFSDAFTEYPFSISSLYFGGQNLACGNLWSIEKDEIGSSMVCFTFDDYENWATPYGIDVYISQYAKLNDKWIKGLKLLDGIKGNSAVEEFKRVALACYVHFKSAENLARFSKYKKDVSSNKSLIKKVVESERDLTEKLYDLTLNDAKIGYEMTNHYFYNANLLFDKLINLKEIDEKVDKY